MPQMLEIVAEKRLFDKTEAWINEAGGLTIVQDTAIDEDAQQYVHLTPQKVRALRNFLARDAVRTVYSQK